MSIEVPLDGGRTQMIERQVFHEDGEDYIRFFSVIGPITDFDERRFKAALRLNWTMLFGAFALFDDQLAIVDTFLIREADPDEVRLSVGHMAKTADRYEQLTFGTDKN